MIKKLKDQKAFAMAEVLAVVVVILALFSTLFSNYLSLTSSYESRKNYNNVTAQYASFYIRKIYKSALEDTTSSLDKSVDTAIKEKGFYNVYDNKEENFGLATNESNNLKRIISSYDIENIIITNYDLTNLKDKITMDNRFYHYVKYLPSYKNNKNVIEPYRLIIKLKDYGFATSSILVEPDTNFSCFDLSYDVDIKGFVTNNYYSEKNECLSNVTIPSSKITIGENTGSILKIGDNSFRNKGITSVKIPSSVNKIGNFAFYSNNIKNISFDSLKVKEFGKYSFANNDLNEARISNSNYKEGVFANNSLTKIIIDKDVEKIPLKMFEMTKMHTERVDIVIPNNIKIIEESAFKDLNFKNITFEENSKLSTISNSAFETAYMDTNSPIDLIIPESVTTIGDSAFKNVNIKSLVFKNDNDKSLLEAIGKEAFMSEEERTNCSTSCLIRITPYVKTIGKEAFKNLGYNNLFFVEKEGRILTIGEKAFEGNPFKLVVLSNSIKEGTNVFGNSWVGEKEGEIIINSSNATSMFNEIDWCSFLYGSNCNSSKLEDPTKTIYKYSNSSTDKYISIGGLQNE